MTGLGAKAQQAALTSHAQAQGLFDRVNGHEPKNRPGNGLSYAVFVDSVGPAPRHSGLAVTSARVVWNARIYNPMTQEPQDAIDPNVLDATDAMFTAYGGDFSLGGIAAEIDILGAHGAGLSARAGYLEQSKAMFRVMVIAIPVIVNDVWIQEA